MINPSELLYSVDANNTPIEPQSRKISHENGIWHRAAHIWIVNKKRQILCQQRSLIKDTNPGLWEPFFGGHLSPMQSYDSCAINELREELGILADEHDLLFIKEYKYTAGTEFQGIFIFRWNEDIKSLSLEPDEVEQVAWKSLDEVLQKTVTDIDPQWTRIGYEKEIITAILTIKLN